MIFILLSLTGLATLVVASKASFVRLDVGVCMVRFPHSGYVQTLVNDDWLDISSSSWTKEDGDVVCRQLGYVEAIDVFRDEYFCSSSSEQGSSMRVITELNCTGSEVAVSDCPGFTVDNVDAENYKPSGVVCAMQFSLRRTKDKVLEILVDYQWEMLCGSLFNELYANVACHQLGYETGQYYEDIDQTIEGNNSTYIYVNGNCTGNEFSLIGCTDDEPYFPVLYTDCYSSVSLHCFSPVAWEPCHISTTYTSCNSVDIEWSFPLPVNSYNVRYQDINMDLTTYMSEVLNDTSFVTTTITNLSVLATYKVAIQGMSNVHGYGSFSDAISFTIQQPELPVPKDVSVDFVNENSVNISWKVTVVNCYSSCLIGFDIQLSADHGIVTNTFFTDQLSSFNTTYAAHISYLKSETLYRLQVRVIGSIILNHTCDSRSKQVFSNYTQIVNVTTLSESTNSEDILNLAILHDPYFSLSFFAATVILLLTLCVVISYRCYLILKHKRKTKKIYKRRISTSDDNMYSAGALSEQSYIPMNSSSVVGSMRTNSRISVMPVIHGPKSLWIDDAQPVPPTTTFTADNEHDSVSHDNTEVDVPPAIPPMISNTKVNGSCDGNDEGYEYYDKINTSDQENSSEEGDNVYDVIESQKDKEILNDEGDNLPDPQPYQSQSQDIPTAVRDDPSIPPPREFAALPQTPQEFMNHAERVKLLKKRGLSSSMCTIPLPPLPPNQQLLGANQSSRKHITRKVSEGHWINDGLTSRYLNEQYEGKPHGIQHSVRSKSVSGRECYHTNTSSSIHDRATAVSFGHNTKDSTSPNYETLVHPLQSVTLESD